MSNKKVSKTSSPRETKARKVTEVLYAAYVAGFMDSGEGFNGETFRDEGREPREDSRVRLSFRQYAARVVNKKT